MIPFNKKNTYTGTKETKQKTIKPDLCTEILQHKMNIKLNKGFIALYDVWPGIGIGSLLQSRGMHGTAI